MTDLEKAARMALEALEYYQIAGLATTRVVDSITALRQALANEALDKMAKNARELGLDYEPAQQEPVDWEAVAADQAMTIAMMKAERKPWVGLTQQDIDIAFDDTQEGGGFDEFARAIEAKLKEKNA